MTSLASGRKAIASAGEPLPEILGSCRRNMKTSTRSVDVSPATTYPENVGAIRQLAETTAAYVRGRLPKLYSRELVELIFEQPYCRISNVVDKRLAQRQAGSRYLKELAAIGVLREMQAGKEKLFIHPKLMQLLLKDSNTVEPYPARG